MQTKLLLPSPDSYSLAARLLQQGQLVGIPTETVYGLAANALDASAVKRIFTAKGRPQDNPLIVHVSALSMLEGVAAFITPDAQKLADAFWPGPLTMVLPKGELVVPEVSAGLGSVAVRMPSHPVALEVIRQCKLPLAAPSANLSGSPSPTTAQHVLHDFQGVIPLILDGGSCQVGIESTVVSLLENPVVLRPGFITASQIQQVLGKEVLLDKAIIQPLEQGQAVLSPGTKYRHYSPKAKVVIIKGEFEQYKNLLTQENRPGLFALCFAGEAENLPVPAVEYGAAGNSAAQASELFFALRRLDELGAQEVYARCPKSAGVGLAVYNRLLRAAGFQVITV